MKTTNEIYEILKREFNTLQLGVELSSTETSGTYDFKQNNFDIFFSYSYEVKGVDYHNGDYLTPSDTDVFYSELTADWLEVTFKGDEIEFTDDQNDRLLELITIKINENGI